MDIVNRLKEFMDYTRMTSSQFADKTQIPRPTLSQIMSGRNKKISNEIIGKLHEAFPQLNVIWLLFGDGEMLNFGEKPFSEPQNAGNLFESADEMPYGRTINNPVEGIKTVIAFEPEKISNPYPTPHPDSDNPNCANHGNTRQQPPHSGQPDAQTHAAHAANLAPIVAATEASDKNKRIASIMVFYTDNSFETFYPTKSRE